MKCLLYNFLVALDRLLWMLTILRENVAGDDPAKNAALDTAIVLFGACLGFLAVQAAWAVWLLGGIALLGG